MTKAQRIRDPVHDLIEFSADSDLDQLVWSLINTPQFQRLRRIKQLGFSELVYPGATHTRFAHSIGVFHTARRLVQLLRHLLGESAFDEGRAEIATCAALLHDLGHGPFSHTFESVEKARGKKKKHEKWTEEIILESAEIATVLDGFRSGLKENIASLLAEEHPSDIYTSIVSSQFDADRLDYLRRDKMMTGTEHGGFDWNWLLSNLEIAKLTIGGEGGEGNETPFEVEGLVLSPKGLRAAEGYLLGRFHLYLQVYMHKTTRSAEKMLAALLSLLANVISKKEDCGLPANHPLVRYFSDKGDVTSNYLSLDDSVVWGSLSLLSESQNRQVAELATRLSSRNLYKCFDVGARADAIGGDISAKFSLRLNQERKNGAFEDVDVLEDRAKVSAYKFRNYESPDALAKVMIMRSDGSGHHEDVAKLSPVVGALEEEKLFRLYARDTNTLEKLEVLWTEVSNA